MHNDLIAQARRLAKATASRPKQVDLRRAISSAYYGCFHALAKSCADSLIGTKNVGNQAAWAQVYRALEHGTAKNACFQAASMGFSRPILEFASAFTSLQEERHTADYDPLARYQRSDVMLKLIDAENAIGFLYRADIIERRAFAAHALFKKR